MLKCNVCEEGDMIPKTYLVHDKNPYDASCEEVSIYEIGTSFVEDKGYTKEGSLLIDYIDDCFREGGELEHLYEEYSLFTYSYCHDCPEIQFSFYSKEISYFNIIDSQKIESINSHKDFYAVIFQNNSNSLNKKPEED